LLLPWFFFNILRRVFFLEPFAGAFRGKAICSGGAASAVI
jgi:hypothetical protein